MAMENKRITQLSTERLTLTSGDYVMVDDADNGSAKYRLDRLKETDSTLSVSGMAADAAATGQAISDETEARENADNALSEDIGDLKSALANKLVALYDGTFLSNTGHYFAISQKIIYASANHNISEARKVKSGEKIAYALRGSNSDVALIAFCTGVDTGTLSDYVTATNSSTTVSGIYVCPSDGYVYVTNRVDFVDGYVAFLDEESGSAKYYRDDLQNQISKNTDIVNPFQNYEVTNDYWDSSQQAFVPYVKRASVKEFIIDFDAYLVMRDSSYSFVLCTYTDNIPSSITGWVKGYRINKNTKYLVIFKEDVNADVPLTVIDNLLVIPINPNEESNITSLLTAWNSTYLRDAINWETKTKDFCALFDGSQDIESFCFFTDPHLLRNDTINDDLLSYIATLQKAYNSSPCSYIVCGGDWLTSGDSKADACWKLGYENGFTRSMFNNFHQIVGNHDTNYQGDTYIASYDYQSCMLSNDTIKNLWFRDEGKNYYKFNGSNSVNYCFDSGIDWNANMNTYRWEQVQWFASDLLTDTDAHKIVFIHIPVYNSNSEITPMVTEIGNVISAFNGRTSVDANGQTYNYSNATGKVEFIMAGHTHADINTFSAGGVPVVITTTFASPEAVSMPTFDLVFADFTSKKLYCVRFGEGSDRVFNLT